MSGGADLGHAVELDVTHPDRAAYDAVVADLVADEVASQIAARVPTLWGPAAEAESAKRLAWVGLAAESRPLVSEIEQLRQERAAQGQDHVVLCGMGGSSLAPEVIAAAAGVELTVLDSSDPDYVRSALADRLERSIVVVSSKSGSTVETDSQKRAYEQAFREAGRNPVDHLVIVTDPGSPLDVAATADGYRVFHADPDVGGRYSALTAFGLVPSGLAGADIGALLDEAEAIRPALEADDAANPGLRLGALLGAANRNGVDKIVIAEHGERTTGFGDWAEQLIAESTGKDRKGILPVVVPAVSAPNFTPSTPDSLLVTVGTPSDEAKPASGYAATVRAPLGAEMLLWEYAVAIAGRLIGIDPFDQPDVESAKKAAREMLDGAGAPAKPAFVDRGVEVYASDGLLEGSSTVADAVHALFDRIDPDRGYLAVMAYLDRKRHAHLAHLREHLALRTGRPTTFGWGPRFLHSTGQYHKGGAPTGVFLQITGAPVADLPIPDRPFTFGEFIRAQAIGDARVLADHGRPVLRLHLTDQRQGLDVLREALR
ncbi:glucose-6-phosphate isomerase [Nocardioides marmoriginsengisoli]|uniref:Glucose-6-phosphate isomerase n=1 Tax=Nocardioides marmoriginsengisoli TaxID=661483 RepID=A0A3N0C8Y5_9ACTN|nr:glucose-6-phosphate isomerase [Nocardioides marmoriginsengisoli]RNL59934.1 glucose-6-phosphate isomerase [Nocardioides marmoriginsengisoli]